jgi:hypothetical protein
MSEENPYINPLAEEETEEKNPYFEKLHDEIAEAKEKEQADQEEIHDPSKNKWLPRDD